MALQQYNPHNSNASNILADLLTRFNAPAGFPAFSQAVSAGGYNGEIDRLLAACNFTVSLNVQKPVVAHFASIAPADREAFLAAILFSICNNAANSAITHYADHPRHSDDAVRAFLTNLQGVAGDPNGAAIRTFLIHGTKKFVNNAFFDFISFFEPAAVRPQAAFNVFAPIHDITPILAPPAPPVIPNVVNPLYAKWTGLLPQFTTTTFKQWCDNVWSHPAIRSIVKQVVSDSRFELIQNPFAPTTIVDYNLDIRIVESTTDVCAGLGASGVLYIFLDQILQKFERYGLTAPGAAHLQLQPETLLSWFKLFVAGVVIHEGTHALLRQFYGDINISTPWLRPHYAPSIPVKESGFVAEMYFCSYVFGPRPGPYTPLPQYIVNWDYLMFDDTNGIFDSVRDTAHLDVEFVKWVRAMIAELGKGATAAAFAQLPVLSPGLNVSHNYNVSHTGVYYAPDVTDWASVEYFFLI